MMAFYVWKKEQDLQGASARAGDCGESAGTPRQEKEYDQYYYGRNNLERSGDSL